MNIEKLYAICAASLHHNYATRTDLRIITEALEAIRQNLIGHCDNELTGEYYDTVNELQDFFMVVDNLIFRGESLRPIVAEFINNVNWENWMVEDSQDEDNEIPMDLGGVYFSKLSALQEADLLTDTHELLEGLLHTLPDLLKQLEEEETK